MMTLVGVGRFVRDPVLKEAGTTHVCEFTLAVNEHRKVAGERKKYAHYFDFVAWDKGAEVITQWCNQGDMILVTATPRQDKWEDSEGRKRSRVVFRVNEFTFLTKSTSNNKDNSESDTDEETNTDSVEEGTPF